MLFRSVSKRKERERESERGRERESERVERVKKRETVYTCNLNTHKTS